MTCIYLFLFKSYLTRDRAPNYMDKDEEVETSMTLGIVDQRSDAGLMRDEL